MRYLSNLELDQECIKIVNQVSQRYNYLLIHFQLMYKYGLRVSEVCGRDNFQRDAFGDVHVFMKKTEKTRILHKDSFLDSIDFELFHSLNDFRNVNETEVRRCFEKVTTYRRLFCGRKEIVTHLFRHNAIKKMFDLTNDINQVNDFIQEEDPQNTLQYVNSQIYYYS